MGAPAGADTPVVEGRPGAEGVIRVGGEVVSAERIPSNTPNVVRILPRNSTFPNSVFFECAPGLTGAVVVRVKWKDATGKEQTTDVVVTCGVKVDKNVTVTGSACETFSVELSELKETEWRLTAWNALLNNEQVSEAKLSNPNLIFQAKEEGTQIRLYTFRISTGLVATSRELHVLVTSVVGPKKVSQLVLPPDSVQQVLLQPNQGPSGLPFNAALSTPQTPAQFAGQGFERLAAPLQAAGVQVIHRSVFRRQDAPIRFWNLISHAVRMEASALTPRAMEQAFNAVRDYFKGRLQGVTEHLVPSAPWGDQAVGLTGQFTLSSGEVNDMLIYVVRLGNILYFVVAQGQKGSIPTSFPETRVAPLMRQMRANLEAAPR